MILGVDIGGTAVKLGLIDAAGKIRQRTEHSVHFDSYKTPILDTAVSCAIAFLRNCNVGIDGIGISATGQIDCRKGVVAGTCGNLPGWNGAPLKETFEKAFQKPVTVMNDANCALLGECWTGGAKGCRDVIMVTLGTGVGGGILSGGNILQGAIGLGGELGHMPLRSGGLRCTCENTGCYEQYASVTALLRCAKEKSSAHINDAKALFAMAENGDHTVLRLLEQWQNDIAAGLVGLTHLFNPELILLGGGVSRQSKWLVEPVREKTQKNCMPRFAQGLRIEAAVLGNDAGMIGAARFWLDTNPPNAFAK